MTLVVGARVRVVGAHRLVGTVVEVSENGTVVDVEFDDFDGYDADPIPYIAVKLEPITPCDCVWCRTDAS